MVEITCCALLLMFVYGLTGGAVKCASVVPDGEGEACGRAETRGDMFIDDSGAVGLFKCPRIKPFGGFGPVDAVEVLIGGGA